MVRASGRRVGWIAIAEGSRDKTFTFTIAVRGLIHGQVNEAQKGRKESKGQCFLRTE